MKPIHAIAALALLAGCTSGQNDTATKVFAAGTLFCSRATAAGPQVVALAQMNGAPVLVTNRAATDVALACAAWDIASKPVPPPIVAVPTVTVAQTSAPK